MSAVANLEDARSIARMLEDKRRWQFGTLERTRAHLGAKIGIEGKTWKNLVLGRRKRVDDWLKERLKTLLLRELEAEMARASHDVQIALQCGDSPSAQSLREAEGYLAKAKAALNGFG